MSHVPVCGTVIHHKIYRITQGRRGSLHAFRVHGMSDARKFRVEGTGFGRLSILDENLNVIDALTKGDFTG